MLGIRSERFPDLAEQVVKALENRGAALIANHGMVAIGTTMERAMHNTALVERSAKIIWGAKQLGGIFPLPEKVNSTFASFGPTCGRRGERGHHPRPARRAGSHAARAAPTPRPARRRCGARRRGPHFGAAAPHRRGADLPRATGRHRDGGAGPEAAAVCALNALAVLEDALGSLDRVEGSSR